MSNVQLIRNLIFRWAYKALSEPKASSEPKWNVQVSLAPWIQVAFLDDCRNSLQLNLSKFSSRQIGHSCLGVAQSPWRQCTAGNLPSRQRGRRHLANFCHQIAHFDTYSGSSMIILGQSNLFQLLPKLYWKLSKGLCHYHASMCRALLTLSDMGGANQNPMKWHHIHNYHQAPALRCPPCTI